MLGGKFEETSNDNAGKVNARKPPNLDHAASYSLSLIYIVSFGLGAGHASRSLVRPEPWIILAVYKNPFQANTVVGRHRAVHLRDWSTNHALAANAHRILLRYDK